MVPMVGNMAPHSLALSAAGHAAAHADAGWVRVPVPIRTTAQERRLSDTLTPPAAIQWRLGAASARRCAGQTMPLLECARTHGLCYSQKPWARLAARGWLANGSQ